MVDTLNMLKPYIQQDLCKLTLVELAYMYQLDSNDDILASSYEKIYKLAMTISKKYWGLDEADIESNCLYQLDFCLRTYDTTKSNSFISYFSKCLSNKFRELTESINYLKRKCILEPIDNALDIGVSDVYNTLELLLPSNLTKSELAYCELASQGYDNTYIANYLKVSRMTICNIRKSLKVKLSTLQND